MHAGCAVEPRRGEKKTPENTRHSQHIVLGRLHCTGLEPHLLCMLCTMNEHAHINCVILFFSISLCATRKLIRHVLYDVGILAAQAQPGPCTLPSHGKQCVDIRQRHHRFQTTISRARSGSLEHIIEHAIEHAERITRSSISHRIALLICINTAPRIAHRQPRQRQRRQASTIWWLRDVRACVPPCAGATCERASVRACVPISTATRRVEGV